MSRASARLAQTRDSVFQLAPRAARQDRELARYTKAMDRLYLETSAGVAPAPRRATELAGADPDAIGATAFVRSYGRDLLRDFRPQRFDWVDAMLPWSDLPVVAPTAVVRYAVLPAVVRRVDAVLSHRQYLQPLESRFVHRQVNMPNYLQQASRSMRTLVRAWEYAAADIAQMAHQLRLMFENQTIRITPFVDETVQWHGGPPRPPVANRTYREHGITWHSSSGSTRLSVSDFWGVPSSDPPTEDEARAAYESRLDAAAERMRADMQYAARDWNVPTQLAEEVYTAPPAGYDLARDPTPTGKGDPLAGVLGGMDRLLNRIGSLVDEPPPTDPTACAGCGQNQAYPNPYHEAWCSTRAGDVGCVGWSQD